SFATESTEYTECSATDPRPSRFRVLRVFRGLLPLHIRLAVPVAAVRYGERAVLLRHHFDPVRRRVRLRTAAASAAGTPRASPSRALGRRAAWAAAARRRRQRVRDRLVVVDVRDEHARAVLLDAGAVAPVQLPDVLEPRRRPHRRHRLRAGAFARAVLHDRDA